MRPAEAPGGEAGAGVGAVVPGWTARPAPRAAVLRGRWVEVRPLDATDLEALHATVCGPGDDPLWTYRTEDRPAGVAQLGVLLERLLSDPTATTSVLVPLEGEHAGTPSGLASYLAAQPAHGSVEIGAILLARHLQRTRAATEALHLLLAQAIEGWGYRRVEWKCDSLNEPSRRAALRLGFTAEGRFRRHLVVKGRNRDTDWFSVLDSDWAVVGEAQRRWLDPAGFDDSGRQLLGLAEIRADVVRVVATGARPGQ